MIGIDKEPIKIEVLIVGGGIGGLMAAIHASDLGVNVLVAEKAHTRRSGSAATGNDHFLCYIPGVHGTDMELLMRVAQDSILGKFNDISLLTQLFKQSFDRVQNWEGWGIPMRPTGNWEFTGHAFPGQPRLWLKFEGGDIKKVLTEQAQKRGVRIENHLAITDLITAGEGVVGAIGISTKNLKPTVKLFRAKTVILTTGSANRLYPGISPGGLFNTVYCPSCTGSGRSMAYRAGAKLVNMEFPNRHAGPKYFARAGKSSWIGVFTDPAGRPVGPFIDKPTKELGDITADVWNSVFSDMHKSGRGPVYMDCTRTSQEDLEYMWWGLKHEGQTALLDFMVNEGIDLRRYRVEFTRYEPFLTGRGIEINQKAETSVVGLYAAGDEIGNLRAALSGAAIFGWIAGESAAERSRTVPCFEKAENRPLVQGRIKFFSELLERKVGATWQEGNLALQQIMNDYAGEVRSETLLKAGLKYLKDLKQKAIATLKADNSHTLMRSLEVIDLMESGEAIFLTALERKETRPPHVRTDFPFTNPLWQDRFITIKQENGQPKIEWRDRK